MSGLHVYQAISAVASDLACVGLPKAMTNTHEGYDYRSIDALLNRLSPILAKHKLCVLPKVLERTAIDRSGQSSELLVSVTLKVAFDLVSPEDGSRHTVEVYGEALDRGDKATAKALTAAYKSAMLQTFCVPVNRSEDADASTLRLKNSAPLVQRASEPPQGWGQWSADITELINSCETQEAVERLQNSNRALLRSLARELPQLYAELGKAFSERMRYVQGEPATPSITAAPAATRRKKPSPTPKRSKANGAAAPIH